MARTLRIYYGWVLLALLYCQSGAAQTPVVDSITISAFKVLDTIPRKDSSKVVLDSTSLRKYEISEDAIEDKVVYGSVDSMIMDNTGRFVFLYGEAFVDYSTIHLKAGFITVDLDSNIAVAVGIVDSSGKMSQAPQFKDGEQEVTAQKMRYNFTTKKGMVYQSVSKENDVYIRGKRTKFISKKPEDQREDDVLYNQNAIFTTCDLPTPHFGIRSTKQKVIPNKLLIIGPSHIEIGGIPTPLFLPFGFFPITKSAHSGLILPRDYEYSRDYGFGLKDVGYYFPINDHLDATVLGKIYLNGSFGIGTKIRYNKKYNYSGSFNLDFSNYITELPLDYRTTSQQSFKITWSHSQAAKANPYHNLSGNINIATNRFDKLNSFYSRDRLNNELHSNVNYRRNFPGKPYNLAMSFVHSQNIENNDITINFPNVDFKIRRIYPIKLLRASNPKKKWYDEISFKYDFSFANELKTKDTLLFSPTVLDLLKYDARHTVSSDVSFRVLKYFNLRPQVEYNEYWHFKSLNKRFVDTLVVTNRDTSIDRITLDTTIRRDTTFGFVANDTLTGFKPFRQLNASATLSTKIFGTMLFKKGKIRGIRHIITPSVSLQYRPDYKNPALGYYRQVDTDTRAEFNNPQGYSTFFRGVTGSPQISDQAFSLRYNIVNNFEGKYFVKKDSTLKKFKLFETVNVNGNYNFVADSFKFSPVNITGSTRLIKGVSDMRFTAVFDPYAEGIDENGKQYRKNLLEWNNSKNILRFDYLAVNISSGMTVGKMKKLVSGWFGLKEAKKPSENNADKQDNFIELFEQFSVQHNYNFVINRVNNRDTFMVVTNTLSFLGSIKLTNNWQIRVGHIGYNFATSKITYPDIGIVRDLHCWTMRFSWQPQLGSYQFFLGVKPGTLDFVKVPYNRINQSF